MSMPGNDDAGEPEAMPGKNILEADIETYLRHSWRMRNDDILLRNNSIEPAPTGWRGLDDV